MDVICNKASTCKYNGECPHRIIHEKMNTCDKDCFYDPETLCIPVEGIMKNPDTDVAHQSHYETQGIQPIEYMEKSMTKEQFIGFLKGNIIKYVSRSEKKDGIKDLHKARVYINWLIEYSEDGKIKVR